jgi:signal transduction histidine kinase
MAAFDAPNTIDPRWRLGSAQLRAADGAQPPSDGAAASIVSLPHRLRASASAAPGAWYSWRVAAPEARDELWAFYTRQPQAGFEVFVNGELVGATSADLSPPRTVVRPTLVVIPAGMLHAGENRLDIRVARQAPSTLLDTAYLGPASELASVASRHILFDVTIKQATVAAMILFAMLFAIIYALRRQDTVFAAYGLTILMWALHVWHMTLTTPPWISEITWRSLGHVALTLFVVCSAIMVNRFLNRRARFVERAWLGLAAVFTAYALIVAPRLDPATVEGFNRYCGVPLLLALGGWSVWQLARAAIANATIERRLMLLCCGLVWIVGVRDFVGDLSASGASVPIRYLPYTVSFVLLAFGSLILLRFARALRETEYLNQELEARVEQKAAELEANYARIRTYERDQALVAERARIMRDMHDGIGGQLVAAIALASRPGAPRELDALLHEALDDLRMMIDSLEATEADLLTALGMLRMRVSSRFAAAGLEFRWEVADVPRIPGFGPEQVLQVMRIVQEAFANILKHAGAKTITVRTATQPMASGGPGVAVEIEDDGRGMQVGERLGGRGMANMRRRAQSLGADLEIGPGRVSGTRIVVRLPLSQPVMA